VIVQCTSTAFLNFNDKIFKNDKKIAKWRTLYRPAFVVRNDNESDYLGVLIFKTIKRMRAVKITYLKALDQDILNQLISCIKSFCHDDFSPYDRVYICIKYTQSNSTRKLLKELTTSGFTLTNVKPTGEVVYTYERSIP